MDFEKSSTWLKGLLIGAMALFVYTSIFEGMRQSHGNIESVNNTITAGLYSLSILNFADNLSTIITIIVGSLLAIVFIVKKFY